jgi:hypothetical protein
MRTLPTKPRGPSRFRKREARRLFEAGAERVEFDPTTGRLIGYRHQGENSAPGTEWDAAMENLGQEKRPP